MDPLTAFSLACGVIQIVDFGTRALSMCKEMYKQGELSEFKELEETTKYLVNAQKDIRLPSRGPSTTALEKPHDKELFEIAKDCFTIATELTTKLQALRIHDPRRKRDRIKMGYKALREKSNVQELEGRLNSHRKALDTHILLGLRQQLDLVPDLSPAVQDLSQRVQTMITELSHGTTAFNELAKAIRNEHAETRDHITKHFLHYQNTQDHRQYRKRLLDSLWFNELWSREERIADAHRETFEWIFDSTGKGVGRWDNFVEWLECDTGIYWINGKAGSGKSTLMSFLGHDSRILESLNVWAAGRSILAPKFYFWSGGTTMEKSIEGLLRSILWQILNQLPDLQVSDLSQTNGRPNFAEPIAAWTERRLRAKLVEIMQKALQTHRLCLFIDGLDEFSGDQEGLISFIQETAQIPGIKMCLSSRPEQVFVHAFASSAKLQLQDLTKHDIQKFVMDKLQATPHMLPLAPQGSDWLQGLTEQILRKAQGVFLWVSLAVKDQIRGLRDDDSLEQLQERLENLPDEVEGIYERMLSRIEKPNRNEASVFLQIALHWGNHSFFSYILACRKDLDAILGSENPMPELELITMSDRIRKRIGIACAGLLEIHDREQEGSEEEDSEQEDSEQEDSEQEDSEQEDSEQEDSEQEESEQEDSEQKDSEQEGSEVEDCIHLNNPVPPTNPRAKGKDMASDLGNSEIYNNAEELIEEEGNARFQDKVDRGASELDEGASILDGQDFEASYNYSPTPGEAIEMEIVRLGHFVNVTFIHRTAVDFMRNEEAGGAFLRINAPPGFDAKVFHVMVLLARLRLFGYRRHRQAIDRIMYAIRGTEHCTGNEQTAFFQLLDSIMWRIDQKHYGQKWSKNHHWSTRWGPSRLLDSMRILRELNPSKMTPYTRFQSSSRDEPNLKTSSKCDFLLLAASYGLHRYVEEALNHEGLMCDRDRAAFLLYGSMLALSEVYTHQDHEIMMASLEFAKEVLKRDVDVNHKVLGDFTLWSLFLWRMHDELRSDMLIHMTTSGVPQLQNAFAKTALAFVDRNADLTTKEALKLQVRVGLGAEHSWRYVIWLELSVLAVLELCLTGHRELFRIREVCKSAGAISHACCSTLQCLKGYDGTREEYKLSDQESSAMINLYYCDISKIDILRTKEFEMWKLCDEIREDRQRGGNVYSTIGEADIE
ncbi:MAG: hypothetical protein Q9195_005412 [Heterodermia aff. obscurata]